MSARTTLFRVFGAPTAIPFFLRNNAECFETHAFGPFHVFPKYACVKWNPSDALLRYQQGENDWPSSVLVSSPSEKRQWPNRVNPFSLLDTDLYLSVPAGDEKALKMGKFSGNVTDFSRNMFVSILADAVQNSAAFLTTTIRIFRRIYSP